MTSTVDNGLKCINSQLPENWEAKLVPDEGRIYYVDHKTESSSWLPPRENWDPGNSCMPYGWEEAIDKNNKPYFINHVENYTTRDDPRDDPDYIEPPKPRDIELIRDAQKGFGFVAGSEKPVVVRFVTEGGPSVDKLLPGDQLIKINGQDVRKAPREYVIDLVRSCKHSISLTVCQPYNDNSARKSALLTAAKKDKLKKNPSRVRFAEEIIVNGASVPSSSPEESYVPFMPNVLKVFLENGQTKSFKYDNKTTVKDVVNSLQEKLNLKCVQHFNLVLHNVKSHMPGRMTLLQEHETVAEIASRPGARHFRCLFRVVYVPRDSYDLLKQDPVAFEYFYMQCVNDVIQERFASELKAETILRLAALHIQQHAMSNNVTGKINIKAIEKECGFEKFVPPSVRENMRVKDLRKVLSQSMKLNQNLTAPGQKQLTALQAKLHYMKIVSELKTFGSRVFMVTLLDKKTEAMVLVGPKAGISLVTNIRFYTLSMLADFSEVQSIKVAKEKENMNRVELTIKGEEPGTLNLGLLKEDANNFVSMVNGYYRIFVDPNKTLLQKNAGKQSDDPEIPPYEGKHKVFPAPWSYPEDLVSMVIDDAGNQGIPDNERIVDLTRGPPTYEGNKEYISRLKEDLGIKSEGNKEERGFTPPPTKKPALGVDNSKNSESVPNETNIIHDIKTDFSVHKDTKVLQINGSVKPGSPLKEDTKSVNSSSPVNKSVTPVKTVIMVDPHKMTKKDHVISDLTNQQQVSDTLPNQSFNSLTNEKLNIKDTLTSQKQDKHETDSIASSSSTGASQMSDSEEAMDDSPVIEKIVRKRTRRSPTPPPSRDRKLELERQLRAEEIVEYENLRGVYYKKMDNENSDTDSGVGGEADKHIVVIHNSIPERCTSVDESEDGEGWETGVELSAPSAGSGTALSQLTDLHIDLSSITNPQFGSLSVENISPGSTTSPDPESMSFCPFDDEHLPQELADAMYDPRMFFSKEVYFDPDIIDLTMLPPYPPTKEEIEELQMQQRMSPLPPSPRVGTPKHSALSKTSSTMEDHSMHPLLQKSMSVGYTPDFLDNDIDAIIDKLIVQPPPTDESVEEVEEENEVSNSTRLGQSWNGRVDQNGLNFENPELSHTVDLGELALDEQYSALVIPPPPEESKTIDEIPIVPPVESVKERRKKFESVEDRTSEMSRILKANMKSAMGNSSKVEVTKSSAKKTDSNEPETKSETPTSPWGSVDKKTKPIKLKDLKLLNMFKDSSEVSTTNSGQNLVVNQDNTREEETDKTESPASVSEKLNELLRSLSVYDDEESTGHFRRTSSLRLNRCSSLDFLATDSKATNKQNGALQTGSARIKPVRLRPAVTSINFEKPVSLANGGPNFLIGSEPITVSSIPSSVMSQTVTTVSISIQRANSYDALAPEKKVTYGDKNDSFASLKAKLQLCRDTLLNRSLRKRSGSADRAERASLDGDRYQSIHTFLQECTVLDPRFKASCLTPQESFDTYNRLCILAADMGPVQVKKEPETDVGTTAAQCPDVSSEAPPLPAMPDIPSLADVKPKSVVPSVCETDDTSLTATHTSHSQSAASSSEPSGLASILGDVIFVKEDKSQVKTDMERAQFEIENFKSEPLVTMSSDPLAWWMNNQWQFPLLASLARKRLCIPATSVPSERVFSTAGDIVTAQRAALSPEVVDMLIFLKKNIEGERKNSLTRSNSFSQLFKRSGKSSETSPSATGTAESSGTTVSPSRDLKLLNTLTTPRSNFRPNTGPMQVQDRMAPKPPTPSSPRTQVSSRIPVVSSRTPTTSPRTPAASPRTPTTSPRMPGSPRASPSPQASPSPREPPVEGRKQKAGPLKALSSVFDKSKNLETGNMKSSKRKAPEAPPLPKSSPPQLLSSESPPGTLIATKTVSGSTSPSLSPNFSPGTASPNALIQSSSVRSVSSSSVSSPFTPAGASSKSNTGESSTPTPPPRRRHLSAFTPKSGDGSVITKTKDDSELKRQTPKSSVKTSPYATVGKMWRPMSMTSSASKDSEEYQSYNNFDALRNMSGDSATTSPAHSKIPNGHIANSSGTTNGVSSTGVKLVYASTPIKTLQSSEIDTSSISERSFAVLREKVSASHTNSVKEILEKVYTSEDFAEATSDVEKLISEFKQTMESLKSSRIDKKPAQYSMCKDELQRQVKQFVTDAKLLVSNATQTKQKLATNMNDSIHSLAKIFLHGQATMFLMEEIHQAQHLGSEVMRVTNAYKSTLNAAHAAVGKPLADPHMKYLMRQATNLATLLSNLLKSLKTLEQR